MTRTTRTMTAIGALSAVVLCAGSGGIDTAAQSRTAGEVPRFQVDPSWPKIPNNWQFGQVSSVSIDAQDHVWVLQRPGTLAPEEKPRAAPPLLEFDSAGTFIQAWGGPGQGYDWPTSEHGVYVDPAGFVWIGGNGPKDHQILKFTRAGKFVMQIGKAGQSRGNSDTQNLNQPADTFVYTKTNELFVADGYGNRRVIVFDATTGVFKRMWGAFGNPPSDAAPNPAPPDADEKGAPQFVQPVHAARVSNDGFVYVSDRGGKRVQVFTVDGKYVNQVFIGRECKAPECSNGTTAASTAFSTDPQQRFLYVGNRSQAKVMILDRKTLAILDTFGKWGSAPGDFGTLHHMAADSKGNLYVTEVTPLRPENRRVQKFIYMGLSPLAAGGQAARAPQPQGGIPGVVPQGAQVEIVKDGFVFTEGPVGTADGGLFFTDLQIKPSRIYRLDSKGETSVFRENTDGANGLAFNPKQVLHAAEGDGKRIVSMDARGAVAVATSEAAAGQPFMSLNDLIFDTRGGVYFTDPGPRPVVAGRKAYVYYLAAGAKHPLLVDDGIVRPNGLTLSNDGKRLFVDDTIGGGIYAFDVQTDGRGTNKRLFAQIQDIPAGGEAGADGMAIDREDRLYVTSATGVQVFDNAGKYLGTIKVPRQPANVAFSGPGKRVLYMTARQGLYRLQMLSQGPSRPGK